MREIDKDWCLGFIDWIQHTYKTRWDKPLSPKSAADYVGYFSTALNAAVRAEVIPENPIMTLAATERIKVPESKREYLTIDEIKVLIDTECPPRRRETCLPFRLLLRFEVERCLCLTMERYCSGRGTIPDVNRDAKNYHTDLLPLSRHAVRWLPERNGAEDGLHVFAGLPAEPNINKVLAKWMATAGINKKITYHTSRHTFATMMLTLGADLYTTSKLLGHANVKTTQIYAKIVDSKKVEAVNLVDNVFG